MSIVQSLDEKRTQHSAEVIFQYKPTPKANILIPTFREFSNPTTEAKPKALSPKKYLLEMLGKDCYSDQIGEHLQQMVIKGFSLAQLKQCVDAIKEAGIQDEMRVNKILAEHTIDKEKKMSSVNTNTVTTTDIPGIMSIHTTKGE